MVLLKVSDIAEIYGLSLYEAQNIMESVDRVNVGKSTIKPRWRTTAKAVDNFLETAMSRSKTRMYGLDKNGKIIRR